MASVTVGGRLVAPVDKKVKAWWESLPTPGATGGWPAWVNGVPYQLVVVTPDALVLFTTEGRRRVPWATITKITPGKVVTSGPEADPQVRLDAVSRPQFWEACQEQLPPGVPVGEKDAVPTPAPPPPLAPRAAPVVAPPRFCSSCGAPLDDGAAFCGQCGRQVGGPDAARVAPFQMSPASTGNPVPAPDDVTPPASQADLGQQPNPAAEQQPPAGWYPNPERPSEQHYWDGQQWGATGAARQAQPDVAGARIDWWRYLAAVVFVFLLWLWVVRPLIAPLFHSDAYNQGVAVANFYNAQAKKLGVAQSWGVDVNAGSFSDMAQELCQVEWVGQGTRLELANTPENKAEFIDGCISTLKEQP